jgi:ATP-dependent RNA helicase DeaD
VTFLASSPPLARALQERDYIQATPVQTAVLQDEAVGRDLLVSAQTGSGKTVAYGLAIAANLLGDSEQLRKAAEPLALIVAPTRELALQVHRELSWLYAYAGARVVSCVGGMDPRREQRELAEGAHIVVGTPGRLCDHLKRNRLNVAKLKAVVLDEADEMLDLGFREDLQFILESTPAERRTLLFSATLPKGIVTLARQFQRQAFRIEVTEGEGGHDDIEYRAIRIQANEVEHAVVNVLRFIESPSALVFCNTRNAVRHLQATLLERGFSVVSLSGELSQSERNIALQALRDGRARVCVATDVAARGIDLPSLGLVIHAELPNDAEVLQHRSGRTGRAGRKGVSVLLVPPARRRRAELLLNGAGIDAVWSGAPSADDIRKLDHERLLLDPLLAEETSEEDLAMGRALLEKRSAEDIAAAFARLYRSRLPSPEDVSDPGQGGKSRDERGPKKKIAPRPGATGQNVWFKLSIGRQKNAEARWLLPMICGRGGITRDDIGAIRIFAETTEFEVAEHAAERFANKIKRPGGKDDNIHIAPLTGEPQDYDKKRERPHPNSHARKAERDTRSDKGERNYQPERSSKPKRPKRPKK